MKLTDEVDVLRKIPIFASLEVTRLKLLAFTSERVRYQAGEMLCSQDELAEDAFVILDGEAEVVIESRGSETVVAQLSCNALVGEMSIISDLRRTATVRAIGEVEVLRISKEAFLRLIHELPVLGIEIMKLLVNRLHETTHELTVARQELKLSQSGGQQGEVIS